MNESSSISRRRVMSLAAGSLGACCLSLRAAARSAGDGPDGKEPAKEPGEAPPAKGDGVYEEQPKPDLVIDEKAAGKTVKAKVGDVVEIRLGGERPMTGWGGGVPNYVGGEKNKPPVLEQAGKGFEDDPDAEDSAVGTYVFRVRAYEAGTVTLTFRYIYPGGHGYELIPRLAVEVVRQIDIAFEVAD